MAVPCTSSQFLTLPQLQNLLRQAGWPENMIAKWAAIIIYESNGCPLASNKVGEYSIGLLQMNMKAHGTKYGTEQQLYNPLWNLQQAFKLWKIQGDRAWFNSVNKYKNNYQGIAAKSLAIYNQGGQVTGNSNNLPVNIPANNLPVTTQEKDYSAYYILGALGVLLILKL